LSISEGQCVIQCGLDFTHYHQISSTLVILYNLL